MELETYEVVMLRRPTDAPTYDEATLDDLQRQHLAFYDDLRAQGIVANNGPFLEQPDENLRGIGIFCTGSLERAREIAERDPLFIAGRIVLDVMTHWTQPGAYRLPGQPITV